MVMRCVTTTFFAVAAATVGLVGVGTTVSARTETTPSVSLARIERVVTLGDSYSSGSGIHRNASDYDGHGPEAHSFDRSTRLGSSACQRELDETPGPRLADQLDADSVFIACAGAVIREIPAQVRAADIPGDGGGTLVTITIGGNDLRTVRDEYPAITVRVLGYPDLMQGNGRCDGVTGISGDEADWIDGQVDLLNHEIQVATARARGWTGADIVYVDVTDGFDNHGACRFWQRDRFVNDAVFGDTLRRSQLANGTVREHWTDGLLNVSTASFHPSSMGYDAYLGALRSSLPTTLLPPPPSR